MKRVWSKGTGAQKRTHVGSCMPKTSTVPVSIYMCVLAVVSFSQTLGCLRKTPTSEISLVGVLRRQPSDYSGRRLTVSDVD